MAKHEDALDHGWRADGGNHGNWAEHRRLDAGKAPYQTNTAYTYDVFILPDACIAIQISPVAFASF